MIHTGVGLKSPLSIVFIWIILKRAVFPLTLSHFTEMVKTAPTKFYPDD
jgi:hypothetical protein